MNNLSTPNSESGLNLANSSQHAATNTHISRRQKFIDFWEKSRPYMLSHHPKCPQYKDHTFRVGKYDFCIGCFVGYPAALLGIILTLIWISKIMAPLTLLIFGHMLILSILLSFTKLTEKKPIKMFQKATMGFGSGVILAGFFLVLPWPLWGRWLFVIFVYLNLNFPMLALHYRSHSKICGACEYTPELDQCPGYTSDTQHNGSVG